MLDKIRSIRIPANSHLALGGGTRVRYEAFDNPDFGLTGIDADNYYQFRADLYADLHLFNDATRTFVQVNDTQSWDKQRPTPVDESDFELHQAFVDFNFARSPSGNSYLRFGRQQMVYGQGVLFTTRLVPNVRQTFDGFRLSTTSDAGHSLDAFAVRPVNNLRTGSFNDSSQNAGNFYGLYGTLRWNPRLNQDLYALGLQRDQRVLANQVGDETRYTLGTRLFGTVSNLDYTIDLIYQTGQFNERDISAWAVSSSYGYTWNDAPGHPGLALRIDAASGDDDLTDHTMKTFDPLFPSNGKFYGNGNYTTLANLITIGPQGALAPVDWLTLFPTIYTLWKQKTQDGVYVPPYRTLPGTIGTEGRFIGTSYRMFARWTPTDLITIDLEYQYYDVDGAIKRAGGRDSQYVSTRFNIMF